MRRGPRRRNLSGFSRCYIFINGTARARDSDEERRGGGGGGRGAGKPCTKTPGAPYRSGDLQNYAFVVATRRETLFAGNLEKNCRPSTHRTNAG